MKYQKTHVIFNPASGGGKTGKNQKKILAALDDYFNPYSLFRTQKPLDATSSARSAILEGSELIIAVGGDGTIQETVNGFFCRGLSLNPRCELGVIDSGTGHGLAQSLGFPSDIPLQCQSISSGEVRHLDAGLVYFRDGEGKFRERIFINECQAGIGGEVVKSVGAAAKRLGGFIAFGISSVNQLFRYPNQIMTLRADGTAEIQKRFIAAVVANGNCMASGMRLAPRALADDGVFDILMIHEQTLAERLWNFPKIYSGRHITSSKFSYFQAKSIVLDSPQEIWVEADGELLGRLPCRMNILPRVLRVRMKSCSGE
jgi:YegS/Rv2252/BmrU family lipid kinase